ncbi:DUF1064 domain-containing protein [Candidatus Dependentiae bacterium]|nr:MAG: DUF1064 domain-containing protein [Candidatus Dependentiae bacterium]
MKSPLEERTFKRLTEAGLKFEYEGVTFVLQPSFALESIESGKKIKKVRDVKYTPDFIGDTWIIETKGHRTPVFDLRWKLFKYFLHLNKLDYKLYMPRNDKQVIEAINDILNDKRHKSLLRKRRVSLKQSVETDNQSSPIQAKNGRRIRKGG